MVKELNMNPETELEQMEQFSLKLPTSVKAEASRKAKEKDSTLTQEIRKFVKSLAMSS